VSDDTCPVCAKGHLVTKTGRYETEFVDRSGQNRSLVLPDLRWEECDACGEGILDDSATRRLEAARRDALGLLSAVEIRELRLRLETTQARMSKLLGIGEKTYCRWESGLYVQSVAFDNYLRLLRQFPEAVRFLEEMQGEGTELDSRVEIAPVFPSLRDMASLQEPAETFTRLMEGGLLHAARASG
jgi:HTH-type transcriptional regulator / antitoxin MqsA